MSEGLWGSVEESQLTSRPDEDLLFLCEVLTLDLVRQRQIPYGLGRCDCVAGIGLLSRPQLGDKVGRLW